MLFEVRLHYFRVNIIYLFRWEQHLQQNYGQETPFRPLYQLPKFVQFKQDVRYCDNFALTEHIEQCKEFTKEVSVGPKVMIFEIGIKIVEQEFLFLSLFCFRYNSKIKIHFEC